MSTGTSPAPAAGAEGVSHVRRLIILWVVLSVVGVIVDVIVFPLVNPAPASAVGSFSYLTNTVFTALAMPVAMFVLAIAGYSAYAFREKRSKDTPVEELEDAPHIQPTNAQQISWLLITTILALLTVGWGMFGFFSQTTNNPTNPLVVNVTGQQWTWTFSYPKQGFTSNVLELPKGVPVELRVTSDDVLHGLAIPQLGVAMDANPGWWVDVPIVTPNRLGSYYAHCVELCGLYHTYMWSKVYVVPKATFANWVSANGGHDNGGSASS